MDDKELFLKRFEEKLKKQLDSKTLKNLSKSDSFGSEDLTSIDYETFRLETLSTNMTRYEKFCNFSEKIVGVKADKKSEEKINKNLFAAHLACSATGVISAAILVSISIVFLGLFLAITTISTTIGIGILLIGMGSYFTMQKIPSMLAKKMKTKANDQIIIAVFYMVAFMRFSSNFELATSFAANYLNPPLSLDFKRILWELDNSKFPTIKAAFDKYLESWRDENLEFLEAIYLIESSLYESEEFRRISLLDKSLETILQGNYEKMLHFAQELRNKISAFNMIGIVLPILGLIILPLAASFGDPRSTWEIVFLLYDIIIPVAVMYFGFIILFNRPTSVNSIGSPTNLKDFNSMQKVEIKISKTKSFHISAKIPALIIFFLFLTLGFSPIIFHNIGLESILNEKLTFLFGSDSPFGLFQEYKIIDKGVAYEYGPYGVYPGLLSLFIPLAFAFAFGYYLKKRYEKLIHLRDATKKLEREFPSATFQLGNRINEGISSELSFGIVAQTMKGTEAGVFFSKIDSNIKFNGMSVEKAIFDKDKGAIIRYPSDLIISSMKIFVRAVEQGPEITAKTLIDLSKYLSDIHMSNERMNDLLTESLSSMKSQASFLAPIISGVVISIVSLVTLIMGSLSKATANLGAAGGQGIDGFLGESIPTYLFQSVVGLYLVMLIMILIYMVTNLENGDDQILTQYEMGDKLIKGIGRYSIVVFLGIVGFTIVGSKILGNIA